MSAQEHAERPAIPIGMVPHAEVTATLRAARSQLLATGKPQWRLPEAGTPAGSGVLLYERHVLKVQQRAHERLCRISAFLADARSASVPTPEVLASGWHGSRWWVLLERSPGAECPVVSGVHLRELGRALRTLHDAQVPSSCACAERRCCPAAPGCCSSGERGVARVWFQSLYAWDRERYARVAAAFTQASVSERLVAVHSDVHVRHNVLWDGPQIAAVLDPGQVRTAAAEVDLAEVSAAALADGVDPAGVLEGYDRRVDEQRLHVLTTCALWRRYANARGGSAPDASQADRIGRLLRDRPL